MRRTRLVINGRTVRNQPPVVGDFCWPPITKNVDQPCVYAAKTCDGTPTLCTRCGFTYCANHIKTHIRKLPPMPPDAWKSLMKRLRAGLELIAKAPHRPLPAVEVATIHADRDD